MRIFVPIMPGLETTQWMLRLLTELIHAKILINRKTIIGMLLRTIDWISDNRPAWIFDNRLITAFVMFLLHNVLFSPFNRIFHTWRCHNMLIIYNNWIMELKFRHRDGNVKSAIWQIIYGWIWPMVQFFVVDDSSTVNELNWTLNSIWSSSFYRSINE